MPPKTTTEYVVECGTGIALDPVFTNKREAMKRYREEKAIPSYFGPGHKRQVGLVKITTTVERLK